MTVRLNAKYVVFSGIAVMMAYVLYHNERFLIEPTNPIWQHYAHFKWWLLPHGIFGALVLLLAPLQFSDRLRRRFTKWHRIAGRVYVVGVLGLAPLGAYIQYYQERMGFPRSFTVLAGVDAAMLITTTVIAFLFAYKRKIAQHRQWVTRSYAVALVFIGGRFVMGRQSSGLASLSQFFWLTLPTTGSRSVMPYLRRTDRACRQNSLCRKRLWKRYRDLENRP